MFLLNPSIVSRINDISKLALVIRKKRKRSYGIIFDKGHHITAFEERENLDQPNGIVISIKLEMNSLRDRGKSITGIRRRGHEE